MFSQARKPFSHHHLIFSSVSFPVELGLVDAFGMRFVAFASARTALTGAAFVSLPSIATVGELAIPKSTAHTHNIAATVAKAVIHVRFTNRTKSQGLTCSFAWSLSHAEFKYKGKTR